MNLRSFTRLKILTTENTEDTQRFTEINLIDRFYCLWLVPKEPLRGSSQLAAHSSKLEKRIKSFVSKKCVWYFSLFVANQANYYNDSP